MILFSCRKNNKGQVAPLMFLVIGVLILAIGATMIIGEATFNQIRLSNIADTTMISQMASFCRNLNQIRQISIGPGGLLVTYVGVQVFLLARGLWAHKGQPLYTGFYISSVLTSRKLSEQAKKLAASAAKDLRIGIYDSAFGAALIDEPKPPIDTGNCFAPDPADPTRQIPVVCADPRDELIKDNAGRVWGIDYARYNKRDYYFTRLLRAMKSGEAKEDPYDPNTYIGEEFVGNPNAGPDNWYKNDYIAYAFTKTATTLQELNACPGQISFSEPAGGGCRSTYFSAEMSNIPSSVNVQFQFMVLIYFYAIPKPPGFSIGVLPYPWAWIKRINVDKTSGITLTLAKKDRYGAGTVLPSRNTPLEHSTKMRIKGSVWSGFEPKME